MALSRRPFDALIARAWLRWEQRRFEEGIRDAFQARDLCKGNRPIEAKVSEVLAYLYANAGSFAQAFAAVHDLAELRPSDVGTQIARAEIFEIAGLRDDALREIDAALEIDSNAASVIEVRNRLLSGDECRQS